MVEDVADAVATVGDPTDKYRGPFGDEETSEANAFAEAPSSAGGDPDDETPRSEETRPAALAGRPSEIQWLRKLHSADTSTTYSGGPWGFSGDDEDARGLPSEAHRQRQPALAVPQIPPIDKLSFYLDDKVIETDLLVDPFDMPPLDVAEDLVHAYMESTQKSFPFLAKKNFIDRFRHCTLNQFLSV